MPDPIMPVVCRKSTFSLRVTGKLMFLSRGVTFINLKFIYNQCVPYVIGEIDFTQFKIKGPSESPYTFFH